MYEIRNWQGCYWLDKNIEYDKWMSTSLQDYWAYKQKFECFDTFPEAKNYVENLIFATRTVKVNNKKACITSNKIEWTDDDGEDFLVWISPKLYIATHAGSASLAYTMEVIDVKHIKSIKLDSLDKISPETFFGKDYAFSNDKTTENTPFTWIREVGTRRIRGR